MIPGVMRRLHEAKHLNQSVVKIWGDGKARREFMDAAELADFIYYAISNFEFMPQNVNVGIGKDFSIDEYYRLIASAVEYRGEFEYDLSQPVGMKRKLVDNSLQLEFGWKAKRSLQDSLKSTYNFFKEHEV